MPPLLQGLRFDQVLLLLREFAWFRGRAPFKLDNSVEPGVEEVLARGFSILSQPLDDLEWELKVAARRWVRPGGGPLARRLEDLRAWLTDAEPSSPYLVEIMRRVLEDPPQQP